MSEEELEEFASMPRKDLPGKTLQAPLGWRRSLAIGYRPMATERM